MCAHVYAYMHKCTHICRIACMYAHMRKCVHMCTHICICAHIYAELRAYVSQDRTPRPPQEGRIPGPIRRLLPTQGGSQDRPPPPPPKGS